MKTTRVILSVLLTLILCFSLVACNSDNDGTRQPEQENSTTTSSTDSTTTTTNNMAPISTQELCWECGDLPVSGNSVYCFNCKCMLCDKARKIGGSYMFCSSHNCNESLCTAQRVKNSQYCVAHKCAHPNCSSERWAGSLYCPAHK